MLIYLLKFSACLAIFMVFYKLFLERENMHHLKRYYLLAALLMSIGIPLITFIQYVEPTIMESFVEPTENFISYTEIEDAPTPTNYTPLILWSLYSFGVFIFALKFSLNLLQIFKKIQRNPKFKNKRFVNVLLTDLVTPHTFFNYIFLNKRKYETQQIPKEVFIHEQTHAKQKHSVDVLFIELLQVIFWFNPLLYFIKRDIKLNHEFLADQAVLKNGIQPSTYQKLLLTFSSNVTEPKLANAINYSSIKKRFTVMKTHTSKQKIWLRSFLLLPLVALTLYGFSERKEVVKDNLSTTNQASYSKDNPILEIDFNLDIFKLNGMDTSLSELKNDFIKATNNEKSDLDIKTVGGINIIFINQIMSELKGHLIKINLDEEAFIIDDTDYLSEASSESSLPREILPSINGVACDNCAVGMTKETLKSTTFSTNTNDKIVNFKFRIPNHPIFSIDGNRLTDDAIKSLMLFKETNVVITVFDFMIEDGLLKSHIYVKIKADYETNQNKATPEEVAEYNKLAKHFNSQKPEKTIIKEKDADRMTFLYNKLNKEQKANAEPLPNMIPPPPPVPAQNQQNPPTQKEIGAYNAWAKKIHSESTTISDNATLLPIVDKQNLIKFSDIYNRMSLQQKNESIEFPFPGLNAKENKQNFQLVPPPPLPKLPLDHVIEMAKKGALFYYEGKSISSDEAIQYLKGNKELNISTKQVDSKEPKVYITKDPIVIKE